MQNVIDPLQQAHLLSPAQIYDANKASEDSASAQSYEEFCDALEQSEQPPHSDLLAFAAANVLQRNIQVLHAGYDDDEQEKLLGAVRNAVVLCKHDQFMHAETSKNYRILRVG